MHGRPAHDPVDGRRGARQRGRAGRGDLTWSADRIDGVTRVSLSGVLDLATEDCLSSAAEEATSPPPSRVVLDLAGVEFCDARGLGALLSFRRRVEDAGSSITIVRARPLVRRVFELVGEGSLLSPPADPA